MNQPDRHPGLLERLEEFEADVVRGLVERLRLATLLHRFPARLVWAGFMFVSGFFTIGLLALLALVSRTPFVFPSLGPTAFLFFFHPRMPIASPRNALFGHGLGILCGAAALGVTGLGYESSALEPGMSGRRVLAAALALAATGSVMILLRVNHPPAGATTLIVALGIVSKPFHLVIIEAAVGLLVLQAIAINRLAGLDFPLWWKPPAGGRQESVPP